MTLSNSSFQTQIHAPERVYPLSLPEPSLRDHLAKTYAHQLAPFLSQLRLGRQHRVATAWGSPLQCWDALRFGLNPEQIPALDAYRRSLQEGTANGQPEAWRLSLGHIAIQTSGAQWLDADQLSLRPTECAELWLAALPLLEQSGLQPQGPLESATLDLGVVHSEACAWRSHWTACTVAALKLQPLDSGLPRHVHARDGRRLLNEIQMLWHSHPINTDREARGLAQINGIWLYGGALPPQLSPGSFEQIGNPVALLQPPSIDLRFERAKDPEAFVEAIESLVAEMSRSPSQRYVLLGQNRALEVTKLGGGLRSRWQSWQLARQIRAGDLAGAMPAWLDLA